VQGSGGRRAQPRRVPAPVSGLKSHRSQGPFAGRMHRFNPNWDFWVTEFKVGRSDGLSCVTQPRQHLAGLKTPDPGWFGAGAGHPCFFLAVTPKAIFSGLAPAVSLLVWSGYGHATQPSSAHGSRQESSRGVINAGGGLPSPAHQVCEAVLGGELEQREVCAAR